MSRFERNNEVRHLNLGTKIVMLSPGKPCDQGAGNRTSAPCERMSSYVEVRPLSYTRSLVILFHLIDCISDNLTLATSPIPLTART